MNGRLFTCAITAKYLLCFQVLELSSNTVKRWLLQVVGVEQVLSITACAKCQTLQRAQKATTTLGWQVKIDKMGRIQKWPWLPTCFLSIESLKNHVQSEVAGYPTSWRIPRCFLCWLILACPCLKCLIHWYDVLCFKSLASKISLQGDRPINVGGASAYSLRRNSGTLSSRSLTPLGRSGCIYAKAQEAKRVYRVSMESSQYMMHAERIFLKWTIIPKWDINISLDKQHARMRWMWWPKPGTTVGVVHLLELVGTYCWQRG